MRRAFLFLATLLMAACTSSGAPSGTSDAPTGQGHEQGPPSASRFLAALRHVRVGNTPHWIVTFSRSRAALIANGGTRDGHAYVRAIDVGNEPADLPQLDIIGSHAETALTVVIDQQITVALTGFDTSRIAPALAGLRLKGERKANGTLYRPRPGSPLGLVDFVRLHDGEVHFGYRGGRWSVLDARPTDSLGAQPDVAAVVSCLGDPLAGEVVEGFHHPNVRRVAIGTSGSAGAPAVDTLCAATASDAQARALAAHVQEKFRTDAVSRNDLRWSDLLSDPRAEVLGGPQHVVRLTGQPKIGGAGALFEHLRDLVSLFGP